ncbi:MAG: tripartite tricarboxylate transporter substrate-binding protein, partial [Pseudomonadota bacterium]
HALIVAAKVMDRLGRPRSDILGFTMPGFATGDDTKANAWTLMRALGVTTSRRIEALPEVPTIAEAGVPGYESVQWSGLLAPAGTPREIIAMLHKEAAAIVRSPEGRARLASLGSEVVASSPEEFSAFIKSETTKWAKVAKAAGVMPE